MPGMRNQPSNQASNQRSPSLKKTNNNPKKKDKQQTKGTGHRLKKRRRNRSKASILHAAPGLLPLGPALPGHVLVQLLLLTSKANNAHEGREGGMVGERKKMDARVRVFVCLLGRLLACLLACVIVCQTAAVSDWGSLFWQASQQKPAM